MKIILNFIPLKSGGGVQVGLDFIAQAILHGKQHEWYLVATEGTPFGKVSGTCNLKLAKTIQASMLHRLWFEYVGCRKLVRKIEADLIYTQFGPHWPGAKLINIVGCAYSNLFYPEINFWERLPLIKRMIRMGIDFIRMLRIRQAHHVIFETEDLARRAVSLKGLKSERVSWVKPSISSLVALDKVHAPTKELFEELPPGFKVLLLSTYNPNKNLELLPHIANVLNERDPHNDVLFVITLPPRSDNLVRIMLVAQELGVEKRIVNVGPIQHEGCSEAYRACDLVILPSQLESFSNTIAEAWTMQRPLLISDIDWARSLCGTGAAYFQYRNPRSAAEEILRLRKENAYYRNLVVQGERMLCTYPAPVDRFKQYLEIIEQYGPH
jgi:glycosyltransferase involved in cell wall biosynthesis